MLQNTLGRCKVFTHQCQLCSLFKAETGPIVGRASAEGAASDVQEAPNFELVASLLLFFIEYVVFIYYVATGV